MRLRDAIQALPEGEGLIALSYWLGWPLGKVRLWAGRAGNEPLPEALAARMAELIDRRQAGEPLQYILGQWDFYGRTFRVDARALIPRPETERLVEALLRRGIGGKKILEIGTGTGIIPITLYLEGQARKEPAAGIEAGDLSQEAIDLARENARLLLGPEARAAEETGALVFRVGDLFVPFAGPYDWIVSNPPYIDPALADHLQKELAYEPALALYAEEAGRAFYRRLIGEAPAYLRAGGGMLLEIGADQGPFVRDLLRDRGFEGIEIQQDWNDRDRMAFAYWRQGR